jgi:hypothetical protein
VHYGEWLLRLEPVSYWEYSLKLVHHLYTEYLYITVHLECLEMIQHLVDHCQALLKAGVLVGPRRPTTLSQFYEVFEQ